MTRDFQLIIESRTNTRTDTIDHVDSNGITMKISSDLISSALVLSKVVFAAQGLGRFNKTLSEELVFVPANHIGVYPRSPDFCRHLAYIADNKMQVDLDNSYQINELMRGLATHKQTLERQIRRLEDDYDEIKSNTILNAFNHRELDRERAETLSASQKSILQLANINFFLDYCSRNTCFNDLSKAKFRPLETDSANEFTNAA